MGKFNEYKLRPLVRAVLRDDVSSGKALDDALLRAYVARPPVTANAMFPSVRMPPQTSAAPATVDVAVVTVSGFT
jgi:hypothetical protein